MILAQPCFRGGQASSDACPCEANAPTRGKQLKSEPERPIVTGTGAVAASIPRSTERGNMAFKAVGGFDPQEVMREQREFQQSLAGTNLRSENGLDEVMNFPSRADAQIDELVWIFRL
jgi:hypothetical protein